MNESIPTSLSFLYSYRFISKSETLWWRKIL